MQRIATEVDSAIRDTVPAEWLIFSSTVAGSEVGVQAFGAARIFQQGRAFMSWNRLYASGCELSPA